ncbi:MAG: tetratricopeptide repeat protein [Sedimentisphaerales bacterium]|nr:tetratricopeptide repeat protein [Sedimentisphaerales bacterium]
MSVLLEIIGTGLNIDTAALIWHWFDIVAAPNTLPEEKQQQLFDVINYARQNKTDQACKALRLYLFDNPSCVLGRIAAGALCIQKNQTAEAIEEFNSVYMRQPGNTIVLYALGYCYERLGNEQQAVEFYQDCLKFKNFLRLPRYRLAAIYFKNGRLADTITEYEMLRTEYPDDIRTLVALGYLYIVTEKYRYAIDAFNTAILIHPDNFMENDPEIEQLIAQDELEDALDYIQEKLADHPERAELYVRQGDILAMFGHTDDAIVSYTNALKIHPDLLEATIKLGTQFLHRQQDELAAIQFNRAFDMNDCVVEAYIGLATTQKLSGNIDEAKNTLSLATVIQPNSAILFAQTAAIRFRINRNSFDSNVSVEEDMSRVLNAHQQELSFEPNNPDLHYRLGVLIMSMGNFAEAGKAFKNALNLNPTFDRARNKLIACLYETNKIDQALDLLSRPNEIDKQILDLNYKTAILYCDKIKFASSLMNLENIMHSNMTDSDATHNISVVLQNLGIFDRATANWENLADTALRCDGIEPNDPFAQI